MKHLILVLSFFAYANTSQAMTCTATCKTAIMASILETLKSSNLGECEDFKAYCENSLGGTYTEMFYSGWCGAPPNNGDNDKRLCIRWDRDVTFTGIAQGTNEFDVRQEARKVCLAQLPVNDCIKYSEVENVGVTDVTCQ
jgi:hypothetical protein